MNEPLGLGCPNINDVPGSQICLVNIFGVIILQIDYNNSPRELQWVSSFCGSFPWFDSGFFNLRELIY